MNAIVNIIVVDDEKKILNALKRLLKIENVNITFYMSPKKAYEAMKNERCDLLITDHKMPYMTGLELIKKSQELNKNIVSVLMTAFTEVDLIINAINKGNIFKYISKPWDNEEFMNIVNEGIDKIIKQRAQQKSYEFVIHNNLLSDLSDSNKLDMQNLVKNQGIKLLLKVLQTKDYDLYIHSKNVGLLAKKFSSYLGYNQYRQELIYYAGILHDIGKIAIRDSILYKSDKLTEKEYTTMKDHSLAGADLIREVNGMKEIAQIVEQHHEKKNGSGYPYGLKQKDILIEAQIIMIADVYVALSEDRSYRNRLDKKSRLAIISDLKKEHVSSGLVEKFIQYIKEANFEYINS